MIFWIKPLKTDFYEGEYRGGPVFTVTTDDFLVKKQGRSCLKFRVPKARAAIGETEDSLRSDYCSSSICSMPSHLKLVVEKHSDGYVAYPLGIGRGAILGQGDSYEDALADVRSAIAFHVETFGGESLAPAEDGPVLEAFVAEVTL